MSDINNLDASERLFAEANGLLEKSHTEIRAAFMRAAPGTPEHAAYVALRNGRHPTTPSPSSDPESAPAPTRDR